MIDPNNLTDFARLRPALEELTLFSTLVAGKPAHRTARLLERMLSNARLVYGEHLTPFDLVRIWIEQGVLERVLREYGCGQYRRLTRCWTELVAWAPVYGKSPGAVTRIVEVDLRSIPALERVYGIGPKTARLIVLHSVVGTRAIPIDTHWIKELRDKSYPIHLVEREDGSFEAPIDAKRYVEYEQYALAEADKAGMSAADYDLMIWRKWNQQGRKAA